MTEQILVCSFDGKLCEEDCALFSPCPRAPRHINGYSSNAGVKVLTRRTAEMTDRVMTIDVGGAAMSVPTDEWL